MSGLSNGMADEVATIGSLSPESAPLGADAIRREGHQRLSAPVTASDPSIAAAPDAPSLCGWQVPVGVAPLRFVRTFEACTPKVRSSVAARVGVLIEPMAGVQMSGLLRVAARWRTSSLPCHRTAVCCGTRQRRQAAGTFAVALCTAIFGSTRMYDKFPPAANPSMPYASVEAEGDGTAR